MSSNRNGWQWSSDRGRSWYGDANGSHFVTADKASEDAERHRWEPGEYVIRKAPFPPFKPEGNKDTP